MKRQRKVMCVKGSKAAETAAMVKKKAKSTEAGHGLRKNEEDKEEKKEEKHVQVEENVMGWASNWDDEDYWPWIGDFVDEQMSWGSVWIPFPDEAFSALYGDVIWDDDIWDLNKEIPGPSQS